MLRAKSTAEAKLTHRCGSSSGDGFALFDSACLVQLLDERDRSRGKDGLGEASKASVDAAEVEQGETGEYTRMNNIRLDAAQGGRGGSVRGNCPTTRTACSSWEQREGCGAA